MDLHNLAVDSKVSGGALAKQDTGKNRCPGSVSYRRENSPQQCHPDHKRQVPSATQKCNNRLLNTSLSTCPYLGFRIAFSMPMLLKACL